MLDYQKNAVNRVREASLKKQRESFEFLETICSPFEVRTQDLVSKVLHNSITLNFHPDRFSNNGKMVIENINSQGLYKGQFQTGTTNGGKTAYKGGDRYHWEEALFQSAYPEDSMERPKYGALNLLKYLDGASVRFGSSFFTLKHEVMDRCTFSYGDSSTHPVTLSTGDTFECVLVDLFKDVLENQKILNMMVPSVQEALAVLMFKRDSLKNMGRNLDYCIESHVHGDVSLLDDVESFYLDSSYKNTEIEEISYDMCRKYGVNLEWIPVRELEVKDIDVFFRGPKILKLAKTIDKVCTECSGTLNAKLLGDASRDSELNFANWEHIGSKDEVFQYLKQLWHTLGFLG